MRIHRGITMFVIDNDYKGLSVCFANNDSGRASSRYRTKRHDLLTLTRAFAAPTSYRFVLAPMYQARANRIPEAPGASQTPTYRAETSKHTSPTFVNDNNDERGTRHEVTITLEESR